MNLFNLNNINLDRDYYITLAYEYLGSTLASRLDARSLITIGQEIDAEIVESTLKQLKAVS